MQEQENTKERDLKPNSVKGGWKRMVELSIHRKAGPVLFVPGLVGSHLHLQWSLRR